MRWSVAAVALACASWVSGCDDDIDDSTCQLDCFGDRSCPDGEVCRIYTFFPSFEEVRFCISTDCIETEGQTMCVEPVPTRFGDLVSLPCEREELDEPQ